MKKLTKDQIKTHLKMLDKEMKPLVTRMTNCVPFNPPPSESSLRGIKMNNPKIYETLMKYLTLKKEEHYWEEQLEKENNNG